MTPTNFAFLNLGTGELILILLIVMLLFGSKKLPELAKSMGQSIRELKKNTSDFTAVKEKATAEVERAKESLNNLPKSR